MRTFILSSALGIFLMLTIAASCQLSFLENQPPPGGLSSQDVNTAVLQKPGVRTPQNLFFDFLEMREEVSSMSQAEIDSLSETELLSLSNPLRTATVSTPYYSDQTLQDIGEPLQEIALNFKTITESQHQSLSRRIESSLNAGESKTGKNRKEIRELLKLLAKYDHSACGELFNQLDDFILLSPGDSFNIANQVCPAGSTFLIRKGVHPGQSVLSSKAGNQWIGLEGAVMDGEDTVYRAFSGSINKNQIAWVELRNYHLHGVFSTNNPSNIGITHTTFRNIAPDSSGQDYGAIKLDNASNINVSYSHFENVASGIRFRFSTGPLQVINNSALNSGRNFFQCDQCRGEGIQINRNSLERTGAYGIAVLEDWINLFKSRGDSANWIQVNQNRARGHSLSGSGSFIMLGDAGGSYQEAIGNIGVNPGQVGIGIAGGENIKVEANAMYSIPWDSSNVAYYSALYSPSCGNHQFPNAEDGAEPNRANWICGDEFNCHNPPRMNYAWTDGKCGIGLDEIRNSVQIDRSMGLDVWNEWLNE
ncbi:MAG: hypothetical protein GVY07_06885 [Bacteroidetes bacterium]|jgi:hypothetical protein|nr:hypothetical protein [Bacteroidota bacterium]